MKLHVILFKKTTNLLFFFHYTEYDKNTGETQVLNKKNIQNKINGFVK